LQQIVDELDHRVLLPTQHPTIRIAEHGAEIVAVHGEKRWHFPTTDCALLPVPNTVAVDECDGQWGVYVWEPDAQ
jgi:6-pyruvoyltetrahydropterin/6-carboxytetrahydropterin synthase